MTRRSTSIDGAEGDAIPATVETARAAEYASFDAFKQTVRDLPTNQNLGPDGPVSAGFTTTRGDRLEFTYPETRVLNGEAVNLSTMPLFEGPYLAGDAGRLVVSHDGQQVIIEP